MTALATDSGRKTPARLAGSAILALQSDDRLVKLVRSGHERAFDAIVERYRRPLVRYCSRILPESRCEDAVQQAFINAHAALVSSDDAIQLKPWLFAITRNAALNMLRQNGWNYDEIPLDFDGVRRPDQVFEQKIELQQTVAAMNGLPERQRDALVMREFEGRSYDEIARALGANDGAVRQLLNRARVTLRSAASALVPPPFVARAAASMPPGDGRRLAEIVGGLGGAGLAKAGATALMAGTLVVGAVEAPLPIGESHKTTREKATLAADEPAAPATATAVNRPVALHPTAPTGSRRGRSHAPAKPHRRDNSGHGHALAVAPREVEREDRHRSGSGDDSTRDRSGSDDTRGGSDDSETHERTGTEDHSGSDDDAMATLIPSDDGTSGSGDSTDPGSGSTESGTSTTSGTSGSDGSTSTSGSSGTSGSGSDDVLETSH